MIRDVSGNGNASKVAPLRAMRTTAQGLRRGRAVGRPWTSDATAPWRAARTVSV
ncbi:hypothetical protein BV133_1128 [Blastochloris viridis]|uniref:Uncharacterized protein n=1 Tax=Blastochloris viridis TaxID=1079 RepID=A0A182D1F5_BLAVI|nr:hypothetical protein BV133_1128 [Blastochloris viridis]